MMHHSWLSRLWYQLCWVVCWAVAKLYFGFHWSGATNVPRQGPVLLLSNHQSHLDPVLVGLASPRQLFFLARKTLFFWPFSWLIRSLGAVAVDRDGSGPGGLRTALAVLKAQEALIMFPEGTRSVDGTLGTLKRGFCLLARRGEATLVPIGLTGAHEALPRNARFPRPARIALRFGPAISPEEVAQLDDQQLIDRVREQLETCQREAAQHFA